MIRWSHVTRGREGKRSADAFVLWTLGRFEVDDGIVGDLIEQRQTGRSVRWLWRQTAIALAHQIAYVNRRSPSAGLGAAIVSAIALSMWFAGTLWLYGWEIRASIIQPWIVTSRMLFFAWHVYCVPLHTAWLAGTFVVGSVVARRFGPAIAVFCSLFQVPVALSFGWPYVDAAVHPQTPLLLHYYVAYVVDMIVTLVGIPVTMMLAAVSVAPIKTVRAV